AALAGPEQAGHGAGGGAGCPREGLRQALQAQGPGVRDLGADPPGLRAPGEGRVPARARAAGGGAAARGSRSPRRGRRQSRPMSETKDGSAPLQGSAALRAARRIVVKVGSSLVTNEGRGLDEAAIGEWCRQLAALAKEGREVIMVSSGAIAEG